MKIEVGKTYNLVNKSRWDFVDVEVFLPVDDDLLDKGNGVNIQTEWKSGELQVTIKNEDEAEMLQQIVDHEVELCHSDFEECDTQSTYSGNSYFVFHPGWTEEAKEKLEADWEARSDDLFDRLEFLEEIGYEADYIETYISNGVEIEEWVDEAE